MSALKDTELNKSSTSRNVNVTILHKERVEWILVRWDSLFLLFFFLLRNLLCL